MLDQTVEIITPRCATKLSALASAIGIALAIAPTWARAETQVHGTPQAVVVEAQNATVKEVLSALIDTFNVQVRSAADLDKRLTGTYEGTLQQTASRILSGYDFVVKSDQSGLEITLFGAGKPVPVLRTQLATKPGMMKAEAPPMPAPTLSAAAGNADHMVPMPSSGEPTPQNTIAQSLFRLR
jgi:hypothetical protein